MAEGGEGEQDDVSFLRTEDMVCLSCTGTGERVCLSAEGFGNRHCFLEGIADKVSSFLIHFRFLELKKCCEITELSTGSISMCFCD